MNHQEIRALTVSSCKRLLGCGVTAATPWADLPETWPALTHGFHRVAYTRWGPRDDAHTVVCAHGFTRNGRDFDSLADVLGRRHRVICPDFPGRGRSEWLGDGSADAGYNVWQYVMDAASLLARLDVEQVDWVGTSMGGLIGMVLAASRDSPVRRLVLNDVGCVVPGAFLAELAKWAPTDPSFDSLDEVEGFMRTVYAGFGRLTDEEWHQMARHGHRYKLDGTLGLAFDPRIAKGLVPPFADVDMTQFWLQVKCPVLLLRGEHSPALTPEVAAQMEKTGPGAVVVEIPGTGHAPALMAPEQTSVVSTWLETGQVH